MQLPRDYVVKQLKPLLEDDAVLKVGQNVKYDFHIFLRYGIRLHPFDDTMLMSYALDEGVASPRHGRIVRALPEPQADRASATSRARARRW